MNERKFINEAVKKLLVSEYIKKETENAGFGGMEMKRTPFGTNITLHVNKPGLVIGRHGSKVQAITENLEKKYQIESPQIEVKEIDNPDLNPQVVSKKIALSLEKGWAYRKAGNTSLRRIVESGARGVIISVSGKLSGERGRMQKFMSGSVKYSGEPARAGMERGFSVAKLKLGVIGVKVGILKNDYKLPDDYVVSEKLGVSTPQLTQADESGKPVVEESVKMPEDKPKGRGGPRRGRKPEEKKPEAPDKKPKAEEKKAEAKPEAVKAAPEAKAEVEPAEVKAKPEAKEAPAPELKPEAAPEVKPEAEPEVKKTTKKAEPKKEVKEEPAKKEEPKPEETKVAEETKEKPKAKKTTKAKAKSEEKQAAEKTAKKETAKKTTKKAEPKKEVKEEPAKKEEKVEEDGAKSKTAETDEQ